MATNKEKNNLFRTFKSEGKTYHTFNNKLHNWDGAKLSTMKKVKVITTYMDYKYLKRYGQRERMK